MIRPSHCHLKCEQKWYKSDLQQTMHIEKQMNKPKWINTWAKLLNFMSHYNISIGFFFKCHDIFDLNSVQLPGKGTRGQRGLGEEGGMGRRRATVLTIEITRFSCLYWKSMCGNWKEKVYTWYTKYSFWIGPLGPLVQYFVEFFFKVILQIMASTSTYVS